MPGVYLIHQDSVVAKAFQDALSSSSSIKFIGHSPGAADAQSKLGAARPDIVYVQMALPDTDGFSLIKSLKAKYPSMYIVPVLMGGESGEVWQRIFQEGLRDVLVPPINPQTVLQSCRQAEQNMPSSGLAAKHSTASSYSIAVVSARGGLGKSIFAINLAISMARRGADLCLYDLSMYSGDFFTMLDQVPRHTMLDVIGQGDALDSSVLRNLLSDHPLGFKFLACPHDEFNIYDFTDNLAKNFITAAREVTEFSIYDTGPYDLPSTVIARELCDLVYLIATRDLSRLLSTQRLIKQMTGNGAPPEKIKVIINNAEVGMEISDSDVEEVLLHPVTAYLPSVPTDAAFSINSGKPMASSNPSHPLSAVIDKLAEYTLLRWDENTAA